MGRGITLLFGKCPDVGRMLELENHHLAIIVSVKNHQLLKFVDKNNMRKKDICTVSTYLHPCCYCSVAKSCPTLCDPMGCSIPGSPVLHYLPEFVQIHVHWVGDAIQPSTISSFVDPFSSCPQSFPAKGSFPMSRPIASGGQSIGASATVLPMNIQGWFPSRLTSLTSILSKGLSRISPAPQIESINSLALSLLYGPTRIVVHDYWKNHSLDYISPP